MARFHVGVQLQPQHTTMDRLREAALDAEDLGVDSVWTWDHFYPLSGDPDGAHFEGWTTMTAIAADTERVQVGHLVICNSYRNPHLLADMARTVDHVSHGRFVLGIGAGWFEKDYEEYEYGFGTPGTRLRQLEPDLYRIEKRLRALNPPPVGELPILIGGSGENVTLRLVAEYADMWNGMADSFAHKNEVLDEWCDEVDRDPGDIERTVLIRPEQLEQVDALVDAGAEHLILSLKHPFELELAGQLIDAAGD